MFSSLVQLKTQIEHRTGKREQPTFTLDERNPNHYFVELKAEDQTIVGTMTFSIRSNHKNQFVLFINEIDNLSTTIPIKDIKSIDELVYNYKHVGLALLEIAFRESLEAKHGTEGRISLGAVGNSHYFYHKYGFRLNEKNEADVIPTSYYLNLATVFGLAVDGRVLNGLESIFLYLTPEVVRNRCAEFQLPIPANLTDWAGNTEINHYADKIMTAAQQKNSTLKTFLDWRLELLKAGKMELVANLSDFPILQLLEHPEETRTILEKYKASKNNPDLQPLFDKLVQHELKTRTALLVQSVFRAKQSKASLDALFASRVNGK